MRRCLIVLTILILGLFSASLASTASAATSESNDLFSGESLFQSLRERMKQLASIETNYTVETTSVLNQVISRRRIQFWKIDDKYRLDVQYDDSDLGKLKGKILAFNGRAVRGLILPRGHVPTGEILAATQYPRLPSEDDPLSAAGFGLLNSAYTKYRSHYSYRDLGNEVIDNRRATKVLQIGPYKTGSAAYTYFYIDIQNGCPRLLRAYSLVENDPLRKLHEVRMHYDDTADYSFPTNIEEEQYDAGSEISTCSELPHEWWAHRSD